MKYGGPNDKSARPEGLDVEVRSPEELIDLSIELDRSVTDIVCMNSVIIAEGARIMARSVEEIEAEADEAAAAVLNKPDRRN